MKQIDSNNTDFFKRAEAVIPLASQTFSKSYYSYVKGVSPLFIERSRGAYTWDIDKCKYIDYVLGLLPIVLGHCHKGVDRAIKKQLKKGILFSASSTLETRLAEMLCELIPSAEMVRFAKNGSDVTSAAVRLARAYTGRNHILVCGYHGWHDWYISTTSKNNGIPAQVKQLTHSFNYNDIESFKRVLEANQADVAAVIMEPVAALAPTGQFLQQIREICTREGIVLIFDEIVTGFRIDLGGAQSVYQVIPDLSCFGKALANGMPISALVGRREIMSAVEDIFFSGTFAGETLSLAAAIATLTELKKSNAAERINNLGSYLIDQVTALIAEHKLEKYLRIGGQPWWPRFYFNADAGIDSDLLLSLFRQEVHKNGLLILSGFNLCVAHDNKSIRNQTLSRLDLAFASLKTIFCSDKPEEFLQGSLIRNVFKVRKD